MRGRLKQVISIIISCIFIFNQLSTIAFADDIKGNNAGNGANQGKSGSQFTWNSTQVGFRVTIVDRNLRRVSNSVDFLESNPFEKIVDKTDFYVNHWKESPKTYSQLISNKNKPGQDTWDYLFISQLSMYDKRINKKPPLPLTAIGNTITAQGAKFKAWFLAGNVSLTPNISSRARVIQRHVDDVIEKNSGGINKEKIKLAVKSAIRDDASSQLKRPVLKPQKPTELPEVTTQTKTLPKSVVYMVSTPLVVAATIVSAIHKQLTTLYNWYKKIRDAVKNLKLTPTYPMLNDNFNINDGKYYAVEDMQLIPLEDDANFDGYADELLQLQFKGQYIFRINGRSDTNPYQYIKDNGLCVLVEPVLWFKPAQSNYTHPRYFYGTIWNYVQLQQKYTNLRETGGYYYSLISGIGWHSMYLNTNWTGVVKNSDGTENKIVLYKPSKTSGTLTISSIRSFINDNRGIAMHLYWADKDTPVPPDDRDDDPDPKGSDPDETILRQSELSRAISTAETKYPGFGYKDFNITYGSMDDSDVHYCSARDCSGHSCSAVFGDSSYRYVIKNTVQPDKEIEADFAGSEFKAKLLNNVRSGTASISGGTVTIPNIEYQTVIWRGKDIPTIASFKHPQSIPAYKLTGRYGKQPAGQRFDTSNKQAYDKNLSIELKIDPDNSDTTTYSVHSDNGNIWHSVSHTSPGLVYRVKFVIEVFDGAGSKDEGNLIDDDQLMLTTDFGSVSSIHSAGYMVKKQQRILFYPYIRMTYQLVGEHGQRPRDVYVLSQQESILQPNDTAEVAWYNDNEDESLTITSTQWSLHAKAIKGEEPWKGKNQVLPGGAILQLSTQKHTSKVAVITWQTLLEDHMQNAIVTPIPNEYKMLSINDEHRKFVNSVKTTLDNWRVVQWVNSNPEASAAWEGGIKIEGGNQPLDALGLNTKTSPDSKYRLGSGTTKNSGNEGDLDILREENLPDIYYKIFATPEGDIYMAKSVGNLNALATINGTNLNAPSGVTLIKVCDKSIAVSGNKNIDIESITLPEEAADLDIRTYAITNLVIALERNSGDDPLASWAPDGRWYNEAFDGFVVVKKTTMLTAGFIGPSVRSIAIDPKLCPPSNSKSDMFTRAFLSQFRLNETSDASIARDKGEGFIGIFKGRDIFLPDIENMYKSKKFYIPNVTVQSMN